MQQPDEIINRAAQNDGFDANTTTEYADALVDGTANGEVTKELHEENKKAQELRHKESTHTLRQKAAKYIYFGIVGWLVCVMVLIFLGSYEIQIYYGDCKLQDTNDFGIDKLKFLQNGCSYLKKYTFLSLSEKITIALITTTTANILGVSYVVAKWLFPVSEAMLQNNNERQEPSLSAG